MYNFNPYNVLLAIATNKTGFVLHARAQMLNSHLK